MWEYYITSSFVVKVDNGEGGVAVPHILMHHEDRTLHIFGWREGDTFRSIILTEIDGGNNSESHI